MTDTEVFLPAAKSSTPTMVVGIVGAAIGVTLGWFAPYVPLVLGIIGLVLLRKTIHDGKRTAGLVLNTITVVFAGIWLVVWMFIIGATASVAHSVDSYNKCVSAIPSASPDFFSQVDACKSH